MATSTVTLDKVYFETLLRRAQFHTPGVDYTTPLDLPTVTIPKLDHDSLLNIAREYRNLRRNLYNGGVTDETLSLLINDDPPHPVDPEDSIANLTSIDNTSDGGVIRSQNPRLAAQFTNNSRIGPQNYTYGRNDNYNPRNAANSASGLQNNGANFEDYSTMPDAPLDGFSEPGNGYVEHGRRQQYAKTSQRTIQLSNLPEAATHAEIANIIRGGMLLDIYLRTNDRTAAISFLEEEHAKAFFQYVKRNDLYIRGKRIEIRWNDRQFILPGHVANKIAIGATRNIVIRNVTSKHTEEAIRNDLEHIHNLVVISVTLRGTNIHIKTNSVHNAMFARTCMMSRTTYKGSRIDWDADECASPIPRSQPSPRQEVVPPKKKTPLVVNRFELLGLDGTDDGSIDDDTDTGGVSYQIAFPLTAAGVAV